MLVHHFLQKRNFNSLLYCAPQSIIVVSYARDADASLLESSPGSISLHGRASQTYVKFQTLRRRKTTWSISIMPCRGQLAQSPAGASQGQRNSKEQILFTLNPLAVHAPGQNLSLAYHALSTFRTGLSYSCPPHKRCSA